MYYFNIVDINALNMEEYYNFKDKELFTTIEWINFIAISQKAKPIIIRIMKDNDYIGYFTGILFKRFGIRIVGSPFEGWSTAYMGFNIKSGHSRIDIIEPISKFLFETFRCLYIQISDHYIEEASLINTKLKYRINHSIELRIDRSDEELFKTFKAQCRNSIRQFEKRGATIELAEGDELFAHEYYEQLKEVFAKQNLVPTYSLSKVLDLFYSLSSEQLLCLRVRTPDGVCIATTIWVAHNERVYFWGAASYRKFQGYRPNESMIWYAIKNFREKGYRYLDMYGERDYKKKFRPYKISYPCIMISKLSILIRLKDLAEKLHRWFLKIKGFGKKKKTPNTTIYKPKGSIKVEVLCATMHQKDLSKYEEMNIQTDVIYANQADCHEYVEKNINSNIVKMITTPYRGVGKNRNIALLCSCADILIFSDDDMVYVDGYGEGVVKAFESLPQADIIIFNIGFIGTITASRRVNETIKKVHMANVLNYGFPRVAIRRTSFEKSNLWVSTLFGGGAMYSAGEDNLFLISALKLGLKIYTYPYCIGSTKDRDSSWFNGYNEKYFFDHGAWLQTAFPSLKYLLIWYFVFNFSKRTELRWKDILKLQYAGMAASKKGLSFDGWEKELSLHIR